MRKRGKCGVPLSCHANVFRASVTYWAEFKGSPEHFYLCRNVLIGWEPDPRNLPQKNATPCLFPVAGVAFLCFQVLQRNMESFESPELFSFTLLHAIKISAVCAILFAAKYMLFFLFSQGRLCGFLWRLLPFEMNRRKWSCFSAPSAT